MTEGAEQEPGLSEEATAQQFEMFFDWMERFHVLSSGEPVGRLSYQLNLYIRDAYTNQALERVAQVAEDYRARFGDELQHVYAAAEDGESYQFTPLDDLDGVPVFDVLKRSAAEMLLAYTDSPTETAGGEFDFFFVASPMTERLFGGTGLLQIAIPARAMSLVGQSLGAYWEEVCKIVRPIHGSGGFGLTTAVNRLDMHQAVNNSQAYRSYANSWTCVEANAREHDPGIANLHPEEGFREWLRTTNWFTVVGDRMLKKIGGEEGIRSALGESDLGLFTYEGGLVLQAGEWPVLGDEGAVPDAYGDLARVLQPLRCPVTQPAMLSGLDYASYEAREDAYATWRERFDAVGAE